LLKADKEAAIHRLAPDIGVPAWRKRNPPGEKALRQLELMNKSGAKLLWQDPPARYEQHTPVDHRVHRFGGYPRQGEENQKLSVRFKDICRRLPGWTAHLLLKRKKLLMEPLGPRKPVDRVEPHPAGKLALSHGLALPFQVTPKTGPARIMASRTCCTRC